MHISAFIRPIVILEHSASIHSTECDSNSTTITVTFKHRAAWATAVQDWKKNPTFLLVAFVDSCGLRRESGERSVHKVHSIAVSASELQVICQMVELSLTEAIHPDREVTINVNTFDVHEPPISLPSSGYVRRQDGGTPSDAEGSSPTPERTPDSSMGSNAQNLTSTAGSDLTLDQLILSDMDVNDDEEYIPEPELENFFWTSQLFPPFDDDDTAINARDKCKDAPFWRPDLIIVNCIILPVR
jgi:hypothetical protein